MSSFSHKKHQNISQKIYIFLLSIVFLLLLSLCIFHIYQLNELLLLFPYILDIQYCIHQVCFFVFLHLYHFYLLKKTSDALIRSDTSLLPAVSTAECMASWGRPISTQGTDTCPSEIFPSVEPPAISDRL